jgi:hypothetical protein
VLQAYEEPEFCLRHCKIIALYTKDSFMFRSRFSSTSPAGVAGGASHGQVSSFAEITVPHCSEHSRKAVFAQSPQPRQHKSKKNNRRRKMELLTNMDEEILFAGVAKIGTMANTFRSLVAGNSQEYFILRPCAIYPEVTNGGPSFQIDDRTLTEWLKVTKLQCPVILRHLLNFFRQWVTFDGNRTQLEPKSRIQPLLRGHAVVYLTASQTTARMTISAALTKLRKYAKVFGSEKVGGYVARSWTL